MKIHSPGYASKSSLLGLPITFSSTRRLWDAPVVNLVICWIKHQAPEKTFYGLLTASLIIRVVIATDRHTLWDPERKTLFKKVRYFHFCETGYFSLLSSYPQLLQSMGSVHKSTH